MTSLSLKPKAIHVDVEEGETGLFFATSPSLKGMLVATKSRSDVRRAVPDAIVSLYAACDVAVTVAEVDGGSSIHAWVAIPVQAPL